jgi:hypothetical protein
MPPSVYFVYSIDFAQFTVLSLVFHKLLRMKSSSKSIKKMFSSFIPSQQNTTLNAVIGVFVLEFLLQKKTVALFFVW